MAFKRPDGTTVENDENINVGVEAVERDMSALSTMEQLELLKKEKLQDIEQISFEDALKEAVTAVPDITVAEKEQLVGVPFVIRKIRVNQGNFGLFVSLTCVTKNNETVVINDGSSGIAAQMAALIQEYGDEKPILIAKGLRQSDYYVDNDTRKVVGKQPRPNSFKQSTFYLNL